VTGSVKFNAQKPHRKTGFLICTERASSRIEMQIRIAELNEAQACTFVGTFLTCFPKTGLVKMLVISLNSHNWKRQKMHPLMRMIGAIHNKTKQYQSPDY